jgi:hypothetical protein
MIDMYYMNLIQLLLLQIKRFFLTNEPAIGRFGNVRVILRDNIQGLKKLILKFSIEINIKEKRVIN